MLTKTYKNIFTTAQAEGNCVSYSLMDRLASFQTQSFRGFRLFRGLTVWTMVWTMVWMAGWCVSMAFLDLSWTFPSFPGNKTSWGWHWVWSASCILGCCSTSRWWTSHVVAWWLIFRAVPAKLSDSSTRTEQNGTERNRTEQNGTERKYKLTTEVYRCCHVPVPDHFPVPRYVRAAAANCKLHSLELDVGFSPSSHLVHLSDRISGGRHVGVLLCRHFSDQKRRVSWAPLRAHANDAAHATVSVKPAVNGNQHGSPTRIALMALMALSCAFQACSGHQRCCHGSQPWLLL